jgi:hypothetical protein
VSLIKHIICKHEEKKGNKIKSHSSFYELTINNLTLERANMWHYVLKKLQLFRIRKTVNECPDIPHNQTDRMWNSKNMAKRKLLLSLVVKVLHLYLYYLLCFTGHSDFWYFQHFIKCAIVILIAVFYNSQREIPVNCTK